VILVLDDHRLPAGLYGFLRRLESFGGKVVIAVRSVHPRLARRFERELREQGLTAPEVVTVPRRERGLTLAHMHELRPHIRGGVAAVIGSNQRLQQAFPEALHVDLAKAATPPDAPRPAVASLETFGRTVMRPNNEGTVYADLRGATSLKKVPLPDLISNPRLDERAVYLDHTSTHALVEAIKQRAQADGKRRAAKALSDAKGDPVLAIYRVLTGEPFTKGSRDNWPWEYPSGAPEKAANQLDGKTALSQFVKSGRRIRFSVKGFPIKQDGNQMKALGPAPDFAELGSFLRLYELNAAITSLYPPGIEVRVLTDAHHRREAIGWPTERLEGYVRKLREFAELAGVGDRVQFERLDEAMHAFYGPARMREHSELVRRIQREVRAAFADAKLDFVDDTARALRVAARLPSRYARDVATMFPGVMLMLRPRDPPPGFGRPAKEWYRMVLADPYQVVDRRPEMKPIVRARRDLLARTLQATISYIAGNNADSWLGYDIHQDKGDAIVWNVHYKPGVLGWSPLVGYLLPWQGAGVFKLNGELAVTPAVELEADGYVPLFSTALSHDQPMGYLHPGLLKDGEVDPKFIRDKAKLSK
jgi:hypothetical protein